MPELSEQDDREALIERLHDVAGQLGESSLKAGGNEGLRNAANEITVVANALARRSPAPQQVSTVEGLDEAERLAQRLRDRGFPKLAPVVRSDLVLRAADALEALIERVKRAEAVGCTCGFGGFHDDINPRCALSRHDNGGTDE